jgi:heme/copper-type cytochrome/quinol oxidase subunit 2
MRPVPYRLYHAARWLLLRAIINLILAAAAAALTGILLPDTQPDSDDIPTAVKLVEFIASWLLWIIVNISILVLIFVALLHAYARMAGVAPPDAGRDRNNPL